MSTANQDRIVRPTVVPPVVLPAEPTEGPALTTAASGASVFARIIRKPLVILSLAWLLILLISTLIPSVLSPYNPLDQDLDHTLETPTATHLLGTDSLGRDLLSRLIHGGSGVLIGALVVTVIGLALSIPAGLLAGYVGGWIDSTLMFIVNLLFAIPGFIVLVTVSFVTNNNNAAMDVVLGVLFAGGTTRIVRASTQSARKLLYVDAAKVSGMTRSRILARHIFPNVTGPLVVQGFFSFSVAFVLLTSLAFLGLGFSPETPTWGRLVYDGTQQLGTDPWLVVPIGVVLIVTILVLNYLGSVVRGALPQASRTSMLLPRRTTVLPTTVLPPTASPPTVLPKTELPGARAASAGPRASDSVAMSIEIHHAELMLQRKDSPSGKVLLGVQGLQVAFPARDGYQNVVDAVSFDVLEGETLGLVGESGCGKTMTAMAISALIAPPGRVSADELSFDGTSLLSMPERDRNRLRGASIALVSQEPMVALDPCFTIGSSLREPLRLHRNMSTKAAKAESLELLRAMGIPRPDAVAASYPHQLSGGLAQRAAIAVALSGRPRLLIADEPTTALDVTIQAEILGLLRGLQAEFKTTIVIVTHDLGVVADLCTRVAVMYAGQMIENGSVEDVLAAPRHPYTVGLLNSTPSIHTVGEPLRSIGGIVPVPADWPVSCRFAARCSLASQACQAGAIPLLPSGRDHASRCIHIDQLAGVHQ